jgi:hypothetical protein
MDLPDLRSALIRKIPNVPAHNNHRIDPQSERLTGDRCVERHERIRAVQRYSEVPTRCRSAASFRRYRYLAERRLGAVPDVGSA